MQKIKIRLPAVMTEFGASLGELGLAISLYVQVDVTPRQDEQLVVETVGVDAGYYPLGLQHPVILGMMRVFQMMERAPMGLTVRIDNHIPIEGGLNAEAVFMQAGIVAGNSLMGNPMRRDALITFGAQMTECASAVTATMLGGLSATTHQDEELVHRSLAVHPYRFILAVPQLEDYKRPTALENVEYSPMQTLMGHQALMVEALGRDDGRSLAKVAKNILYDRGLVNSISGYAHVGEVARLAGALGVMTSGRGPAMVFVCERHHNRVAEVIETAFENLSIGASVMVVGVDTQGIVISMMTSG